MKKTFRVAILFLIAILIVTCTLVAVMRERPKCDLDSLILSDADMPDGWQEEWTIETPALERLGANQAYGIFMRADDHTARHTVYQYTNRWLAVFYVYLNDEWFFPSAGWDWSDVEGIGDLPLQADQLWIKCGNSNDPYLNNRCAAVLRYGPYISRFSSSMQEGIMSLEQFKQMLQRIDTLFARCMG